MFLVSTFRIIVLGKTLWTHSGEPVEEALLLHPSAGPDVVGGGVGLSLMQRLRIEPDLRAHDVTAARMGLLPVKTKPLTGSAGQRGGSVCRWSAASIHDRCKFGPTARRWFPSGRPHGDTFSAIRRPRYGLRGSADHRQCAKMLDDVLASRASGSTP
jgi:hypothetical protein